MFMCDYKRDVWTLRSGIEGVSDWDGMIAFSAYCTGTAFTHGDTWDVINVVGGTSRLGKQEIFHS